MSAHRKGGDGGGLRGNVGVQAGEVDRPLGRDGRDDLGGAAYSSFSGVIGRSRTRLPVAW
jgi:hypothetical protein